MKKLFFLLIISSLSLSTAYASQDIAKSINRLSTLKSFSKNHSSAKKDKIRNWKDRKAHTNTKATNRLAVLSFWLGIGALISFSAVAPIGLLLMPASATLGLIAWYRRPSKKSTRFASMLGAVMGFVVLTAIAFLAAAFVIWALFWGLGKFFD